MVWLCISLRIDGRIISVQKALILEDVKNIFGTQLKILSVGDNSVGKFVDADPFADFHLYYGICADGSRSDRTELTTTTTTTTTVQTMKLSGPV
jgi:hypothetical protein